MDLDLGPSGDIGAMAIHLDSKLESWECDVAGLGWPNAFSLDAMGCSSVSGRSLDWIHWLEGRRGRRIERVRNPWVLAAVIQFREMSFQGDSVHGVSPVLVTGGDMGGPLRGCVAWCPLIWVLGNQRGGREACEIASASSFRV